MLMCLFQQLLVSHELAGKDDLKTNYRILCFNKINEQRQLFTLLHCNEKPKLF